MAVKIEFGTKGNGGPHHCPHTRQHIALTVVVPLRDHGPMEKEHDSVNGECSPEVPNEFVAQLFVHRPWGDASGSCERLQAHLELPTSGRDPI
jgi:hypothetical protein